MTRQLRKNIADWHGAQAANCYVRWMWHNDMDAYEDYIRHILIAERMWGRKHG